MKAIRVFCIFLTLFLMTGALIHCGNDDDDEDDAEPVDPTNVCDQQCYVNYQSDLVECNNLVLDCVRACDSGDEDCVDGCLFSDDICPDIDGEFNSCIGQCDSCAKDFVPCNDACAQSYSDCSDICEGSYSDDLDDPEYEECVSACGDDSAPCYEECRDAMTDCSNWYSPEELELCEKVFGECGSVCAGSDNKEMWLCVIDCNIEFNECVKESMETV